MEWTDIFGIVVLSLVLGFALGGTLVGSFYYDEGFCNAINAEHGFTNQTQKSEWIVEEIKDIEGKVTYYCKVSDYHYSVDTFKFTPGYEAMYK